MPFFGLLLDRKNVLGLEKPFSKYGKHTHYECAIALSFMWRGGNGDIIEWKAKRPATIISR